VSEKRERGLDKQQLLARLAAFDGRHTAPLEDIAATLPASAAVLDALCAAALAPDPGQQSAATWLLKRLLEKGGALDAAQTTTLLQALERASGWQAQLHILQTLDKLSLPAEQAETLWRTLAAQTTQPKRMLRAWAYHGMAALGQQHSAYRAAAAQRLAGGAADAAASVRARIRRLRQSYDWLRP